MDNSSNGHSTVVKFHVELVWVEVIEDLVFSTYDSLRSYLDK